jgi:hypothetical protein
VEKSLLEMPSIDFIKSEYPLHWLVWNNEYKELEKELSKKVVSISVKKVFGNEHVVCKSP